MIVIYIALGIFALLLLVLIANTVVNSLKARKLTPCKTHYSQKVINEYSQRLAKMIQCRTVSVKGSYDDTEFKKLRETMVQLFPEIHKTAEIKIFSEDCWIYKIKGSDESRNIMLMSHHDVVAADGKWSADPFAAEIKEEELLIQKHRFLQSFLPLRSFLQKAIRRRVIFISVHHIMKSLAETEYPRPLNILKKII